MISIENKEKYGAALDSLSGKRPRGGGATALMARMLNLEATRKVSL